MMIKLTERERRRLMRAAEDIIVAADTINSVVGVMELETDVVPLVDGWTLNVNSVYTHHLQKSQGWTLTLVTELEMIINELPL